MSDPVRELGSIHAKVKLVLEPYQCTDSRAPRVHNRARIGRPDARLSREAGAHLALGDGGMISASDDIAPVLAREVQWDALLASRLVSEADVRLVKSYDKKDADARNAILTESGPELAQAFLNVLRDVTHQDVTHYVLATIVQLLDEDKARARVFHLLPGAPDDGNGPAYADFFRVLAKPDWFAQEKALHCLARLVDQRIVKDMGLSAVAAACGGSPPASSGAAPMGAAAQTIVQLVQWLCGQLRQPSHPERAVPSAVSALATLLGVRDARPLVTHSGGVALLTPLLRGAAGPHNMQMLYEAALCVWLLTFHPPALTAMARGGTVGGLMEVARTATKEKVVRVAVLALRNIAEGVEGGDAATRERGARGGAASGSGSGFASSGARGSSSHELVALDEAALKRIVANLKLKGFADEELAGALVDLEEGVLVRHKEASSWERYRAELLSGSLTWTAAHTDEGFWRESAAKLTDNNCQLLRVLVKIMEASTEPRTLAVACHDLGEFATHYPAGRFLAQDMGGKEHAMRLLTHADDEVRKQALLCTQKLLVANWQFIGQNGGGSDAGVAGMATA